MRRMYSENQLEEIIKTEVESGKLDNAKPIYYHPITVRNPAIPAYLSFLILDNDSEEISTKSKLIAKIKPFARITPLSGALKDSNNDTVLICAYAFKNADEKHYVLGVYVDGNYQDSTFISMEDIINNSSSTISDGINKIN